MPSAAEMTWVAKFHLLSMTFAIISLVESVLVLYFYYKRCEDLGKYDVFHSDKDVHCVCMFHH